MGQYYMPILRDEAGNFCAFYSHTYGNGLKLMEHSYIGNNFVNAVCNQIYKKPHNVCWFGDYRGDFDKVGEWWGDLIEISNEPPKNYELMGYDEEIDD